jgi:hypothetical protein
LTGTLGAGQFECDNEHAKRIPPTTTTTTCR